MARVAKLELVVNALCWEFYCVLFSFICSVCRKGCRRKIFFTLINTMIMNTNIGRNFYKFLRTFKALLSVHHNTALFVEPKPYCLEVECFFVIKQRVSNIYTISGYINYVNVVMLFHVFLGMLCYLKNW